MNFTRGLALTVRFLLEIALLVGAGVWTWHAADGGWRWVAVIAVPLVIAVVWGLFLSPRATITAPPWLKLVIEAVLFLGVGAGLWVTGFGLAATIGNAIWIVDRIALALSGRRTDPA